MNEMNPRKKATPVTRSDIARGTVEGPTTVTVAVPSVGRPVDLVECLAAIGAQVDPPDVVMVVAQAADSATQEVARSHGATLTIVDRPGLAAALEAGIAAARTTVISFVDDDARARPDWVSSIRSTFAAAPRLGVLGGRDNVDGDDRSGSASLRVGVITRGRIIGNHHLGHGGLREASHVKGANMSVRVEPARRVPLSELVVGEAAQARNELILCLGILHQGFTAAYNPAIQVDHYPAKRAAGDERTRITRSRVRVQRENEQFALAVFGSMGAAAAFAVRAMLIGDRKSPGILLAVVMAVTGTNTFDRVVGTWEGVGRAAVRAIGRRGERSLLPDRSSHPRHT